MKKALLLHSSQDGQTIKIMEAIKETLKETHDCELQDLHNAANIAFEAYDKILIGAAVRYGHLNKKVYQFIERHKEVLKEKDNAFFCVNLTARKEGKDTPEGSAYMKTFLKRSNWIPKQLGVFAGALRYPKYRWYDRLVIQFIMTMTGGETDPSKEVEYTDWHKVTEFAHQFGMK